MYSHVAYEYVCVCVVLFVVLYFTLFDIVYLLFTYGFRFIAYPYLI